MKLKLTIKLLLSMLGVYWITMTIYVVLNTVIYKSNISFGEKVFSVSFDSEEFTKPIIEDLEEDVDFNLEEENIKKLEDSRTWIQILDNENREIFEVNKPENIPISYNTADLIEFIQNPWQSNAPTTINVEKIEKEDKEYTMIVGYPIDKIFKFKMTLTEEGFKYHKGMIIFAVVLMSIMAYLFSKSLVKPMVEVVDDINDLKNSNYKLKNIKKGIFKDVSKNINELASNLKENDEYRKDVDKAKEEWIANISHDLKTPLSSIKGYAELLNGEEYDIDIKEAKRYGSCILENSNYMQDLVDDLSLVYKLKNKAFPLKIKEENLVALVQESIIEILNNSNYEEKEINLNFNEEIISFKCDKNYLKRAIKNLIINSLEHNPKETKVEVSIFRKDEGINIVIEDDGIGIKEEDIKNVFNRYYKGSNKNTKSNGSGLGMAIAKEVIEYHKGNIKIESKVGLGTKIEIILKDNLTKNMIYYKQS